MISQDLLAVGAEFETCLDCRWPFWIGVVDEDRRCPRCVEIFRLFGEEDSPEEDCS